MATAENIATVPTTEEQRQEHFLPCRPDLVILHFLTHLSCSADCGGCSTLCSFLFRKKCRNCLPPVGAVSTAKQTWIQLVSLNKNAILNLKKIAVFSVLFAARRQPSWGLMPLTHTHPQFSIFTGTFTDKLQYPAPTLPLPMPTNFPDPNLNLNPILTTTLKPCVNIETFFVELWGPAKMAFYMDIYTHISSWGWQLLSRLYQGVCIRDHVSWSGWQIDSVWHNHFFFFLLFFCGTEDLTVNKLWQFVFLFVSMRIIKKNLEILLDENLKIFWGKRNKLEGVLLFCFNARIVVAAPLMVMLIPLPALSKCCLLSSIEVCEVRGVMPSVRTELRIRTHLPEAIHRPEMSCLTSVPWKRKNHNHGGGPNLYHPC